MNENYRGKRVTVMGLGRFGGGVGVTRWLCAQGAHVVVTDRAPAERLHESLDAIADCGADTRLGRHEARDFCDADLIVASPAVPDSEQHLQAARAAGVPITSEISLFLERCRGRIVAVTGSVGKSTVTAMIGHVLERTYAHGVWVGGNLGRSLLSDLPKIDARDVVVLELSSFQLHRAQRVRWQPSVAVLTNIVPNHLDWHGDMDAYVSAKLNVFTHQDSDRDAIVLHAGALRHALVRELAGKYARRWTYSENEGRPLARLADGNTVEWRPKLSVPGAHNVENAAAAFAVAGAIGIDAESATASLASFAGLPHRLQAVGEYDGLTYYNDSKSTAPDAAITAMRAVSSPLLMILGGYDKGLDMTPAALHAAKRARYSACIGQTGRALAEMIRSAGGDAEYCGTLPEAVRACRSRACAGDAVVLSPACASWDQFVDYRARGDEFVRLARRDAPGP